ncbi:MAG: hypothetical protein IPM29_10350 [Planctomycetes bacterium]|nr:hypothetical protein [Planctomycetota bacterium]
MVSRFSVYEDEQVLRRLYVATQAGELFEVDPVTGAYSWLAKMRQVAHDFYGNPVFDVLCAAPVRDLVVIGSQVNSVQPHADRARIDRSAPGGIEWWLETKPSQNYRLQPLSPLWYKEPSELVPLGIQSAPYPPTLPVWKGVDFSSGRKLGVGCGVVRTR